MEIDGSDSQARCVVKKAVDSASVDRLDNCVDNVDTADNVDSMESVETETTRHNYCLQVQCQHKSSHIRTAAGTVNQLNVLS